jgi:hypothetical protein
MEGRNLHKFLVLIPCGKGRSLRGTVTTNVLDFLVFDDEYNHFLMMDMFSKTASFVFLCRRGCIHFQNNFLRFLTNRCFFRLFYCDYLKPPLNASWTQSDPALSGKILLSWGTEFHRIQNSLYIAEATCNRRTLGSLLPCHRQFLLRLTCCLYVPWIICETTIDICQTW